jgi:hypothetical protein
MDRKGGDKRDSGAIEQEAPHVVRQHSSNPRVFRQHVGSVSDAWWPAHLRRSLATGRIAQGRRLLLLCCRSRQRRLAAIFQFGTRLLLVGTSMAIGGLIVAALLLRAWYILLFTLLLLILLTLIIAAPAVMKLARALHLPGRRPIIALSPLRNLPRFPGAFGEPETPLPVAPLVRVLETYDLSASEVQHFVASLADRDTSELRLNLGRRPAFEDDEEDGEMEEIVTDTQLL